MYNHFIKINLIAAPLFVVTTQTMERADGLYAVNKALDMIKTTIESYQGIFKIVMPVSYHSMCFFLLIF